MRHSLVLFFALAAAGCPDAVPGERTAADPTSPTGDGGTASTPGPREPDATVVSTIEKLGDASGNLALGPNEVYVATADGIVAFPRTGGPRRTVTADAGRMPNVRGDRIAFLQASELVATTLAGTSPESLARDVEHFALGGARTIWISTSSAVKATVGNAPVTTIRDADSSSQPTALADTPDGTVVLALWEEPNERVVARKGNVETTLATAKHTMALVAEGGHAYWLDEGVGLRTAPLGSAAPLPRPEGTWTTFDGGAMAVTSTHVYWTSRTLGAVFRARRDEGVAERIAGGFDFPDETVQALPTDHHRGRQRLRADDAGVFVSDRAGVYRIAP